MRPIIFPFSAFLGLTTLTARVVFHLFGELLIISFFAVPCHIPVTENGIYKYSSREGGSQSALLNETSTVENGEVVEFSCKHGYNVQGPSNIRCWHGNWDVTSLPDCTPGK
jgi:hypothetical protein